MLHRLRNLFSAKGQLASPPPALLEALGVSWSTTASGVAVSPEVALRCPAVSCAVRAIAEATACLPLSIYRVGADGSREEATDHPVHALLTGTWNDWTGAFDGLYAGTVDALCNDRGALIWVNRIAAKPRELIRYKPGAWSVDRASPRMNRRFAAPIGSCRSLIASTSALSAQPTGLRSH